jgi:hypothetical protein
MKLGKILTLVLTLATANISAVEGDRDYSLEDVRDKIISLARFITKSNFENDQSQKQDALEKMRKLPISIYGKKSLDPYCEKIISRDLVYDIGELRSLLKNNFYAYENDISIKKEIANCLHNLAKMQRDSDLYSIQAGKKQDEDDLSKLHQSFVKNFAIAKTKKPNIFQRIWGYDPEMVALRKTFQEFNPYRQNYCERLANIFCVDESKIIDFLCGFDSKTVLNNFYTLMKEKQYVKDGLDTADNSFNITETEQDPFLKKIN